VSTGWPAVRDKCRDLGITFRPWQDGAGRLILAKRADGKYAATIGGTGMSIPRQVGKTFLVGAIIFALCILCPNLTVLWTAHRLRTAEETFGKMQAFARRRKIKPYILKITLGSGEETILFRNGSRILFGARERGFGLGFDEVDIEVFDEAQRLTEGALDDMIPATNQSRQPTGALVLFMGTPPRPTDAGEVFTRMRTEALSGEDDDTAWVEFGADPGFVPTAAPAPLTGVDWEQVAKANPSFPDDTPREAILRMRKKLGPDSFLREGLGIWDAAPGAAIFGADNWEACSGGERPPGLRMSALAVAVSYELTHSSIGAAGMADDVVHVKPLQHGRGTHWLVQRAKDLQDQHGVDVVIDSKGPAAVLIRDFRDAGVRLKVADTSDALDAFATLLDRVQTGRLAHQSHPELEAAVTVAAKRPVVDRFALGRKSSGADISTLEAVMLAAWWAGEKPAPPPAEPQTLNHDGMSSTADLAEIGF
jgi:hypothetical protein